MSAGLTTTDAGPCIQSATVRVLYERTGRCDSVSFVAMMKPTKRNEVAAQARVLTLAAAVKYIDRCGFCMLFGSKNVALPSLYCAVARRNPYEDWVWDKYSSMIWRWKDELPRRRLAYYGKYLRGRGTLISLEQLPNFLAMCETAVVPGDSARFYRAGRIGDDARMIWTALEDHGPMATLELRNACRMDTKAGNKRFKRGILELQCLLIAVHFGAEQETKSWASGRYELTYRAFPKQNDFARRLSLADAQRNIAAKLLERQPGAEPVQIARIFGWLQTEAVAACQAARQAGLTEPGSMHRPARSK
jgi:hypothetical protein